MTFSFDWFVSSSVLVGALLGYLIGRLQGNLAPLGRWRLPALIGVLAATAAFLVYYMNFATAPVLVGMVVGGLLSAMSFSITGMVALVFVGLFMFNYGFPLMNSWRTVLGAHQEAIHSRALDYTDAAIATLNKQDQPVLDKARAGELNLDDQDAAQLHRGTVAYRQDQGEKKAILASQGITFGDFGIPVTHAATDDPRTWFDTGMQVCGSALVTVWGSVTSDEQNEPSLYHMGDVRGWINASEIEAQTTIVDGQIKPKYYSDFPETYEPAPYMSLLLRAGVDGPVSYTWKSAPDNPEHLTSEVSTRNPSGCASLYAQFNDFTHFPGIGHQIRGTQNPEFFARNHGTQPVYLNGPNLKTEGVQAKLIPLK